MAKTGISVGLQKGHVVSERTLKPRPASRKGVSILGRRNAQTSCKESLNISVDVVCLLRRPWRGFCAVIAVCRGGDAQT
eukprot:351532-Chlamydomonas_euryale.AAC.8